MDKCTIVICPICKKKEKLFSVSEIQKNAPCIDCQLKMLGKRK